jgi:hypothetical protein
MPHDLTPIEFGYVNSIMFKAHALALKKNMDYKRGKGMEGIFTFWPNDVPVPAGWERVTEEDIEKAKRICEIIKKRRLPSEKILILPRSG